MTDDTPLFPVLRGRHIFPAHFIVRDEHLAAIDIIAEIPEMHEERHDIVRRGERRHIILEGRRVYGNRRSGHHAHDCIAQAGLVEVDVDLERLIRLGTVPVRIIPMRQHRLDDAFRAVNMRRLWETVPIVPGAALGKIHVILRAQLLYLILGKPYERGEIARILHRIFREHIERRMRTVFLDGQNARHIGEADILLVLQPIPQKVEILAHSLCAAVSCGYSRKMQSHSSMTMTNFRLVAW